MPARRAVGPRGRLLLLSLPLLLLVVLEGRRLRDELRTDPPGPDGPGTDGPGDQARIASTAWTRAEPTRAAARLRPAAPAPRSGHSAVAGLLVGALALTLTTGTAMRTSGAGLTDSSPVTGNAFASSSLAAPTGLSATTTADQVNLSWAATTSSYATGYLVLRGTASGGPYTALSAVNGKATTTFTDSTATGTAYYVVAATYQNWTSTNSTQANATVSGLVTTAYTSCTAQQADTGGKGGGYETNPLNACSKATTAFATDTASGTTKTISCTDPGKDRHRFSSYNLPVPATATSIKGIEVQLIGAPSTGNQTGNVCIELSGDGGATWTTAPRVVQYTSTTFATFTLGGPTDLWGRTWTPSMFSNTNFRLRVTDVDNTGNKSFYLDYTGVSVTYQQ